MNCSFLRNFHNLWFEELFSNRKRGKRFSYLNQTWFLPQKHQSWLCHKKSLVFWTRKINQCRHHQCQRRLRFSAQWASTQKTFDLEQSWLLVVDVLANSESSHETSEVRTRLANGYNSEDINRIIIASRLVYDLVAAILDIISENITGTKLQLIFLGFEPFWDYRHRITNHFWENLITWVSQLRPRKTTVRW